jgi:uncharacterized protein YkwD
MVTHRQHALRLAAIAALALAGLAVSSFSGQAAGAYAQYARAVLTHLPENAGARPDLEGYLDKVVSSYRQSNGRKGLIASNLMREAARAQAADMMLDGRSGHRSRQGDSFVTRFSAFVDDADLYRAKGENAASNRVRGQADLTKAKAIFGQWLDSGGHRRNLMSRDYEYVSTGVIERGDELWAVQIFWSKPVPPNSNPLIIGIGQ